MASGRGRGRKVGCKDLEVPEGSLRLRERDVSRQIADLMLSHGWRAFRMQSGLVSGGGEKRFRVGERGIPDWLFIRYRGGLSADVVWVEVKAGGRGLTVVQRAWHEFERSAGAEVLCVSSLEEFVEEMGRLGVSFD